MIAKLDAVIARLRQAEKVLVIGHIKPDGDDISSVACLVLILRRLGKVAEGCIADSIPWYYRSIGGVSVIRSAEDLKDYEFDTAVTVDASDLSRIGKAARLLSGNCPHITLDHHKTNHGFGILDFCDVTYAATAMIVYEIGKKLVDYDRKLAEINLLGIATDTGFFRYSNADYRAFAYAAELIDMGADVQRISSAVLEHRTLNGIKLLTDMFTTLRIADGGRLAWAYVTAEMLTRNDCSEDDTEGFVGEIRAIHGVEIAVLFTEWPENNIHVSFRSKSYADVSDLAVSFGGGGHARAAGCSLRNVQLNSAIENVIAEAHRLVG